MMPRDGGAVLAAPCGLVWGARDHPLEVLGWLPCDGAAVARACAPAAVELWRVRVCMISDNVDIVLLLPPAPKGSCPA